MVEDDTFTYHVKQLPTDRTNTAVHSLITKERTQKLDLLIHLLSNLTQALVVCGPQGVGKTTLLSLLQQRNTDSWRYCLIQGNADLSFEVMQERLAQVPSGKPGQSLARTFGQSEDQRKQVVLIVDNAGELVPGLISAIIHYVAENPVLRVIFALTHDELQVKRGSDKAVDDCHIIEIPTLSEKQCCDFLQQLSTNPALNLPFKAIGENMIAHIYRETHGVPGRIITELSGLPNAKQGGKLKWILALTVAGAIAIVFGVQWLTSKKITHETLAPITVEHKTNAIEIPLPRSEPQVLLTLPPVTPQQQTSVLALPLRSAETLNKPEAPVSSKVETQEQPKQYFSAMVEKQTAPVLKNKAQTEALNIAEIDQKPDKKLSEETQQKITAPLLVIPEKSKPAELSKTIKPKELSAPSTNNFTLQLIVLSKQSSVDHILKKYPQIDQSVRIIKTMTNGQDKFILEYGSYPDAISANQAKQSLPAEFHNAMVRKQGKK